MSVNARGQRINNVATPVAGTDAVNKDYVDGGGLDPAWATAPFWAVSFATGNDAAVGWGNTQGAADAVPLRTMGEFFRRVPNVTIAETVCHVLDSQPESELPRATWQNLRLRNVDSRVRIIGQRTTVAIGGGFTGVITAYTAAAPGTNGEALVTIASLPSPTSWTGLIGRMIRRLSDGAFAWVLFDHGSRQARISQPSTADPMGSTISAMKGSAVNFAVSDVVELCDVPELPEYPFGNAPGDYQDNLVLGDVRLHRATEGTNMVLDYSAPNVIRCRLTDPVIKGGAATSKFIGCLFDAGPVTVSFWAAAQGVELWYPAFLGTCMLMSDASLRLVRSCDIEGSDGVFAAFALQDGKCLLQMNGVAIGMFRSATPVFACNFGSEFTNLGSVSPIYGSGNSDFILSQAAGTRCKVYRLGLTATTSAAHPLLVGDISADYSQMDPTIIDLSNGTELLDTT